MHERPSLLPFLLPISSNFLPFFFVPFHHFSSLPPSSYQEGGKCSMHAFRLRVNSPQYLSQLGRKKRTIGKLDRVSGAVSLILGFYHHLDLFFPLVPFRDTSLPLSSLFPLPSSAKFLPFFFLLFRSVSSRRSPPANVTGRARIINSAE